jgi:hypothetical protein
VNNTYGTPSGIRIALVVKQTAHDQDKALEAELKRSVRECGSCKGSGKEVFATPTKFIVVVLIAICGVDEVTL